MSLLWCCGNDAGSSAFASVGFCDPNRSLCFVNVRSYKLTRMKLHKYSSDGGDADAVDLAVQVQGKHVGHAADVVEHGQQAPVERGGQHVVLG